MLDRVPGCPDGPYHAPITCVEFRPSDYYPHKATWKNGRHLPTGANSNTKRSKTTEQFTIGKAIKSTPKKVRVVAVQPYILIDILDLALWLVWKVNSAHGGLTV